MKIDKSTINRMFAVDRRVVAVHEAAHFVTAYHFGVAEYAETFRLVEPSNVSKTYIENRTHGGKTGLHFKGTETQIKGPWKHIIGVAGAVGQFLDRDKDKYFQDCETRWQRAADVHEEMSETDCRLCNVPTFTEIPDSSIMDDDVFVEAVDHAVNLLTSKLAKQWKWAIRRLIVPTHTDRASVEAWQLREAGWNIDRAIQILSQNYNLTQNERFNHE